MSPYRLFFALAVCVTFGASAQVVQAAPVKAAAAHDDRPVPVAQAPAWVSALERRERPPTDEGAVHGGLIDEIVDDQFRLGEIVEHYVHRVKRIVSPSGVDDVGQLRIEFDPSYEHLTLHRLQILRASQSIDALKVATVRVADDESEADQRLYNGRRTAHLVIHDLRVGDVLDYDYTIEGQNPVLGGHFVTKLALASARPVERLRVRIVTPASRSLAFRTAGVTLEPTTRVTANMRELTWERRDVPETAFEKDTPSWYPQVPRLTVSEFESWAGVAAWAVPLFEEGARPHPDIAAAASNVAQNQTAPAARALAALRFVQNDVRYLGIEMGAHSHRPHAAADVLKQRFGDCKDKSVLLVALLASLGIEAHAVLLDTDLREHIEDELPSPYAFDHVIVRIRLDGRSIWVDPTRTWEHGPLGDAAIRFGKALVAARDTTDLSTIDAPFPKEPTMRVREIYNYGDKDSRLEVTRTFRDGDARAMRRRLAELPRAKIQKYYLDGYATMYPTVEATKEFAVEDHADQDIVVLRESYWMPDSVKEGVFSVRTRDAAVAVGTTQSAKRQAPIAVDHPTFERYEIEVRHENGIRVTEPPDENFHDSALSFTVRSAVEGPKYVIDFELRTHRDFVPPSEVAEHMAMVDRILDATSFSFSRPDVAFRRNGGNLLTLLASIGALFGIVGLVVATRYAVMSWERRRWSRPAGKPPERRSGDGETAAKATWAPSREAAEKLLCGPRCPCGARFSGPPPEITWGAVVYDNRAITSARAVCPKCDKTRIRYFEIA